MKKIAIAVLTLLAITANGQILTQNFDSTVNISSYINFSTTTDKQFNGIGPVATGSAPGASVVTENSNKLQFKRSTSVNSYFVRKYLGYNYPAFPAYGALISQINNSDVDKDKVAKSLGFIHQREGLTITSPGGYNKPVYNLGYKIVINFNYASSDTGSVEFPDSVTYKNGMANVFAATGIKPVIIAVENEEPNKNYHSGFAKQYINELKGGVTTAHSLGYKITNGGITAEVLRYLTYHDYLDRNKLDSAQSFFNRTASNLGYNTHYNQATLQERGRFCDTLVRAYHDIAIDYVNFHWYGGDRGSQSDVLEECIDFLERVTGKKAITNEIGQYDTLATTVTDLLTKTLQKQLPIVMWYDGDGNPNPAVALTDQNDVLRPNGIAFRNFLANNGLSYKAPAFISLSFKVNATGSTTNVTSGNNIMFGNDFHVDANDETSDSIHSKISILLTSDGKFKLGDGLGAAYPLGDGYTTEQTVKWYINNSGGEQTYIAPNGNLETIANDTWDLWIGTVKAFDDHASFRAAPPLTDVKFIFNQGAATIQLDDINITRETGGILPVKLLSFTGRRDGTDVLLKWATAAEQNNSHFNVLHSLDGRNFKTIGTVSGYGRSNAVNNYSYTHYHPNTTTNYYQLEQVDLDGRKEFSMIIAVDLSNQIAPELKVHLLQNSNIIQVEYLSTEAFEGEVLIYDMNGRKAISKHVSVEAGYNSFKINAAIAGGSYVCSLKNKEKIVSKAFIK